MKKLLLVFLLLNGVLFAQDRMIRGYATIGELNQPGVGGISIEIKGTSTKVASDNDGEYRIKVSDNESVLVFSYQGMHTQEIKVGKQTRINVDLVKIKYEKGKTVFASEVRIILNEKATDIEKNVAGVLKKRFQKNSTVSLTISDKSDLSAGLNIYLGLTNKSKRLETLCKKHNITLQGINKPFAEGYATGMVTDDNASIIIAVGADNRGVLYAAGEILRRMKVEPMGVHFNSFYVSTSPAYKFRGANNSQGGSMRKYTKARAWTTEERNSVMLDYALAGANCFYAEDWEGVTERTDFLKSFDMMTEVGIRPNQYKEEFPEEWKSGGLSDWEGDNWVCPNIPEAREALLLQWEEKIKKLGDHDILRFFAGDPGGCRDKRCKPWGKTFVLLCEEIAKIALKNHPDLIIMIANQDLTTEGDNAIFDYLSEKPRKWLYGMTYGPGSNAMSWYFRHKLSDDIFEYSGYGWLNRYLAETLNNIPKKQKIVHFSDITHWFMSQYNVENPERNIVKSYGRRTWHARPKALYNIFQAIMPFSEGDIIYTEGYHDHFNQYFWHRLLWNPHQEVKEVVHEYCMIHFGKEAADLMTNAIFQMEKNLEISLATNTGIDRYYALVKKAGQLIPENLMMKDHLWRLHMQKATLDKYNQLKLQHESFQEKRIRQLLKQAIEIGKFKEAIDQSLTILAEPKESPVMAAYRVEANKLGIESEKIFGIRNAGYFVLNQQLRDISGLLETLKQAKSTRLKKEQKKLLEFAIKTTFMKTDYWENNW